MLNIISALNKNYTIGYNNKLMWHIPGDLKRFKKITYGKTIIMGRKTFESLPDILSNRKHIVITRNPNYIIKDKTVIIINDIKHILNYEHSKEEVFVIGGGEIYKYMLPYCARLYLTKIDSEEKGDTYFPKLNMNDYTIIECEKHNQNNIKYSFITLEKL